MARIEAEVPDEADARSVEPEGVSTTVDRRLSVTRAGLGETMHAAVCELAMTSVGVVCVVDVLAEERHDSESGRRAGKGEGCCEHAEESAAAWRQQ